MSPARACSPGQEGANGMLYLEQGSRTKGTSCPCTLPSDDRALELQLARHWLPAGQPC